jgi:hypothetical protein
MGFKDIFSAWRNRNASRPTGVGALEPLSLEGSLVRDYDLYLVELHDELPDLVPQRDAMRAA